MTPFEMWPVGIAKREFENGYWGIYFAILMRLYLPRIQANCRVLLNEKF
jgi:hypothetical protein